MKFTEYKVASNSKLDDSAVFHLPLDFPKEIHSTLAKSLGLCNELDLNPRQKGDVSHFPFF
jgi:hypothetical protein